MIDNIIGYIIGVVVLLFFMFMSGGCSALGVDMTEQRTIVITKPPYQIIISGDLKNADKNAISQILKDLETYEYKDYKFNENINVHVIGSETDIESVNIKKGADDGTE